MSLHSRPLVFIGPMGSGKSSLGRRMAAAYGGEVFDTDREFVKRYGDISAFFANMGEAEFRKAEEKLMIEAAMSGAEYISTGGGAVLNRRGMNALRAACDIVYLTAPTDILESRIKSSGRPLKNKLKETIAARGPLYLKYADYVIDTSDNSVTALLEALSSPRKNRYDVALCDSDDTLLDFQASCEQAIRRALDDLGVKADRDRAVRLFKPLTVTMWNKLENGEITRDELFLLRERQFASELGVTFGTGEFNTAYRNNLRKTRFVRHGATEFLDELRSRGIKTYIITNADAYCASERLLPLMPHVDGAFISEALGCNKPEKRFFDKVFEELCDVDRTRVIVFGDSETSDISGGVRYGLDTCLYDTTGKAVTAADFKVRDYAGFLDIV